MAKVQPHTTTPNPTASWQAFSGHSTSVPRQAAKRLKDFDEFVDVDLTRNPSSINEGVLMIHAECLLKRLGGGGLAVRTVV